MAFYSGMLDASETKHETHPNKVAAPLKKIVLGETFIIGLTEKGLPPLRPHSPLPPSMLMYVFSAFI